ncbi:MAG: ferritin [Thermoanaerobaculia bacterium]|nr:ferritin [Thermoanaerobaculia bacterium]
MKLSEELKDALNAQIGHELGASHQYLAIAAHFDAAGLAGLARFFYRQSDEERDHAMKFLHFVVDSDGARAIPEGPAPRPRFGTAAEAVGAALEWEQEVTRQIYALVAIAREDGNLIAQRFLDWFVDEQFEEVTTMSELLQVVERAGEDRLFVVEEYLEREGKLPPPSPPEE